MAARNGHTKIVQILLDNIHDDREVFENMLLQTCDGKTVLHIAAYKGHNDIFLMFLKQIKKYLPLSFTRIVMKKTDKNYTILHKVAYAPTCNKTIKALSNYLKKELGKNKRACAFDDLTIENFVVEEDLNKCTALHAAAYSCNVESPLTDLLNFVKENIEDYYSTLRKLVLRTDGKQQTVLHIASVKGHVETCKALLTWLETKLEDSEKRSDIITDLLQALDGIGKTALHYAQIGVRKEVSEYLNEQYRKYNMSN